MVLIDERGVAKVDVALSVYGKPCQTMVTLCSLFEHSGHHIGRIWFQEEPVQPYGDDVSFIPGLLPDRDIFHYKPDHYIGWKATNKVVALAKESYRRSIRYQRAWEDTDKDYIFITHNDCLYTKDIIGGMLGILRSQVYVGVGQIGQCWNCPAARARLCDGDSFEEYDPTYDEVVALMAAYPAARTGLRHIDRDKPMPLPECRLNEFGCLINVGKLRHEVAPIGSAVPIGTMGLDTGTDWFGALVRRGYRFFNWHEGLNHGYFIPGRAGHKADIDKDAYVQSEQKARAYLQENYGITVPRPNLA